MVIRHILFVVLLLVVTIASSYAEAAFVTYSNEAAWQAAASPTHLEDFESYPGGAQITTLPALGVSFEPLAGGGFPSTYFFPSGDTTHGPMHLANFLNQNPEAGHRYDDIVMNVLSGY